MRLHDYQRVAVKYLHENPRAGLFLEMGLGKTAAVLCALTDDHLPALVLAPKRVAENTWPEERDIWRPDLDLAAAVGGPAERHAALGSKADLYVISQDNLKDLAAYRHNFKTLVIDESSGYKNYQGTRFKIANAMSLRTDNAWILTGTPAPNGYQDIWAQVFLLDQGKRLGKNITTFRNRFMYLKTVLPSGGRLYDMREGAEDEIKHLISDICMYMGTEGRIKLPAISYPEHRITLPPSVMKFYRKLKEEMVADMEELGLTVSAENAGILSNRLSQVASGFVYEYPPYPEPPVRYATPIHREKIEEVTSLIEQATSPCIVAYRYQWEEEQYLRMPGARSIRSRNIVADWNKGDVPILIAHPASAGHGLNLQHGGNHLIWGSPTWSLEGWQQMNKRLHRQGQTRPVVSHKVIAKGTTDTLIYNRLEKKRGVQQGLLDHLTSSQ